MSALRFPAEFRWGAATSAYQIEGAVDVDGRGKSIWDEFCRRPGAIAQGETGAVACDHYHRWPQDLDLLKQLGLNHYRFSVAWPRVLPDGNGNVNQAGLDFYQRLVDGMLERGIEPFLTLYHWDLPLALEREGGWRNRKTALAFERYARTMIQALGDRVRYWTTFNEMPCIVNLGHRTGEQAPGAREDEKTVRQINHHVLLAHGLAAQALRSELGTRAKAGLVHLIDSPDPLTEDMEDIEIARRGFEASNSWMLDPIFQGRYPQAEWEALGADVPEIEPEDLKTISTPLDFLGINAYSAWHMAGRQIGIVDPEPHFPRTEMGWPITPDCLYWCCRFVHERYAPPEQYITESGCAWPDAPNGTPEVHDFARIHYLRAHLRGVHRALSEGIPVQGFFVWSLLDNFEWSFGYGKRFGITYVDYATQQRTPKLSAKWYSRLARCGQF